MGLLDPGQQI